jgi:hypothetical protein
MKTRRHAVLHFMLKELLPAASLLASFEIHGQGTVNFSNVGLNSPVGTACAPTGFMPAPAGTTFSVALYFAPYGPANLVPPDPSTMTQLGASAFLVAAGIYDAGIRTANVSPPGGMGWFQVRAWETAYGSTYEQAWANGANLRGVSGIILIGTGDPTVTPATITARLTGIRPIVLNLDPIPCVPEPSPSLLVFLVAATVCFLSLKNPKA